MNDVFVIYITSTEQGQKIREAVMPKQRVELRDGDVILRPFRLSDAEVLFAEGREEEKYFLIQPTPDKKISLESIERSIVKGIEFWDQGGPQLIFGICFRERLVGWIQIDMNGPQHKWLEKDAVLLRRRTFFETECRKYEVEAVNLALTFLRQRGFATVLLPVKRNKASCLLVPSVCGFNKLVEFKGSDGEDFALMKCLRES